MKLNKKGFTLIETVVCLAIIAVVGTMFIYGFLNVTTLMKESTLIKNITNDLYQDVISNDSLTIESNNTASFKIDGNMKNLSGVVQYAKDKSMNETTIKISKFVSDLQADMLPSNIEEIEEVDPETCLKAEFRFLGSIVYLPENYQELEALKEEKFTIDNVLTIKIEKSIDPKVKSVVFGNQVGKYVITPPTDTDYRSYFKNSRNLETYYYEWLDGSQYTAKWFCIEPPKDSNSPYIVYGYLLKKDTRDFIVNYEGESGKKSVDFYSLTDKVLNDKHLDIDAKLSTKSFKINDDETIYSYTDLVNLRFIKDSSKNIYLAKEVMN